MHIRMVGPFTVTGPQGEDLTPRGSKARALLAMLCRTQDHCRPRRWLEARLWSDRGHEQASGSLRQTLSEIRKSFGPWAGQLLCDRDSVCLTGFVSDLDDGATEGRLALAQGREFLEGIDIIDLAFCAWLKAQRQRLAAALCGSDHGSGPNPQSQSFALRLGAIPEGTAPDVAHDLAGAIARLTAEYLLRDTREAPASAGNDHLPEGLDLHIDAAWAGERALLKLRLVAQADRRTIWSQRLIASRVGSDGDGNGAVSALVFETTDAPLM